MARAVPGLRLGFYPVWSRWHGGGHAPRPSGTTTCRLLHGPFAAETVVEGLDHAAEAFIGLLRGENTGKMVVRL